jgi:hypothetical protein
MMLKNNNQCFHFNKGSSIAVPVWSTIDVILRILKLKLFLYLLYMPFHLNKYDPLYNMCVLMFK